MSRVYLDSLHERPFNNMVKDKDTCIFLSSFSSDYLIERRTRYYNFLYVKKLPHMLQRAVITVRHGLKQVQNSCYKNTNETHSKRTHKVADKIQTQIHLQSLWKLYFLIPHHLVPLTTFCFFTRLLLSTFQLSSPHPSF